MRHTIELDTDNQLAYIRYRGPMFAEHAVTVLKRMIAMPGWTPRCSRIVLYDEALLGEVAYETLIAVRSELSQIILEAYRDTPTYTAHVCADRFKQPIVDYWISLAAGEYPVGLTRVDTIAEAQAWIARMRAEEPIRG